MIKYRYAIIPSIIILCALSHQAVARAYIGQIPIVTNHEQINPADVFYYLQVKLNGSLLSHNYPVQIHSNGLYVDASTLAHFYIPTQQQSGLTNLSTIPNVKVKLNSSSQILNITVPANWLPKQNIDIRQNLANPIYHTNLGLVLNYQSFYQKSTSNFQSLDTYLNARLFGSYGFLVFSGVLNVDKQKTAQYKQTKLSFIRDNISWEYDVPSHELSVIVGDNVTQGASWYTPVRFAGLSIFKNYGLRPDIRTYPLPIIKGTAAVPSAMQLFINGQRVSNKKINSGPFVLSNIPFINGAGEATLVTKDQFGHETTTTIPLYESNKLLRKDIATYDINIGTLRYNFGSSQSYYRHWMTTGSYKRGLTDSITAKFHFEAAKNLLLLGAGSNFKLYHLGIMNASLSDSTTWQANHKRNGEHFTAGYTYDNQHNHFSFQYNYYSHNFNELATYDTPLGLNQQYNEQFIYSHNFNSGTSLAIALFRIKNYDSSKISIANLSLSLSHALGGELLFSLSRSLGHSHNLTGMLDWSFSFGDNVNGSFDTSYNAPNQLNNTISLSHSEDKNNTLGWSLEYNQATHQTNGYKNLSLSYPTDKVAFKAGIYGSDQYHSWLEASGSLVIMQGNLFFTQNLGNAFLMVNTQHVPNVPYYYDNMYQGKTNADGVGFISNVIPNTASEIDIDPSQLPANIAIGRTHQSTYIKAGTGAVVRFDIRKTHPVMLTILNAHNKPLPAGSIVYLPNSKEPNFIGYHGEFYLQDGATPQSINIDYGNNKDCQLTYLPKKPLPYSQTVFCLEKQQKG